MNYTLNEDRQEIRLNNFERSTRFAEIKAVYRSKRRTSEKLKISSAWEAADYFRTVWNKDRIELAEEFLMICLDGSHQVLGWVRVSTGGFTSTSVDPRVVFSIALQAASSAIVVAHNHPSGCLEPSQGDILATNRLRDAGRLLKIALLDHLIVTTESYYSFAESGLL